MGKPSARFTGRLAPRRTAGRFTQGRFTEGRFTRGRLMAGLSAAVVLGTGSAAWAATSAPSASAASAARAATVPACTATDLAVWVNEEAAQGAAGTAYYPLEFTNTSGHACATGGYAGVSATDAGGHQLGDAAARDPVYRGHVVVIPAGGTAHALFGYGAAEVSTSGCKPTTAAQLKVYPPNSRTAINAFFSRPACTIGGSHVYLRVAVIQPGTKI
jgi:Protein of unknown function (DUF4232)